MKLVDITWDLIPTQLLCQFQLLLDLFSPNALQRHENWALSSPDPSDLAECQWHLWWGWWQVEPSPWGGLYRGQKKSGKSAAKFCRILKLLQAAGPMGNRQSLYRQSCTGSDEPFGRSTTNSLQKYKDKHRNTRLGKHQFLNLGIHKPSETCLWCTRAVGWRIVLRGTKGRTPFGANPGCKKRFIH